jgi:hypothetical protein
LQYTIFYNIILGLGKTTKKPGSIPGDTVTNDKTCVITVWRHILLQSTESCEAYIEGGGGGGIDDDSSEGGEFAGVTIGDDSVDDSKATGGADDGTESAGDGSADGVVDGDADSGGRGVSSKVIHMSEFGSRARLPR